MELISNNSRTKPSRQNIQHETCPVDEELCRDATTQEYEMFVALYFNCFVKTIKVAEPSNIPVGLLWKSRSIDNVLIYLELKVNASFYIQNA